jgi:hypothetical protein
MWKGKTAAEIRALVAEMKAKAEAVRAKLTDGLSESEARKIAEEHAQLVVQMEEGTRALAEAEAAEASDGRTAPPQAPAALSEEVVQRRMKEALDNERTRIGELRSIGRLHGMTDDFIADHETRGTSVAEFRSAVLDKHAERQRKEGVGDHGSSGRRSEPGAQDETVTRREAMAEYILARHNAPGAKMTERARELYRGMNALDLIREALAWKGEQTRGLDRDEIAQRGLMSTSDFPNILANVANKTLAAAYQAAPRTFSAWTRNITLPDFKPRNILRRGETPQLAKLRENGEYKRGSIAESKETIQLTTYGIVVGITRQVIINDDLGALVGIPSDFGLSASTLESDIVYGILLGNPTLNQDSTALFDVSTHNNLVSSGTAIDISPLASMRARMAKQKGLDGKTLLNILASILLVPPELETRAEQLLASFIPNENAKVNPEWIRSLTPISEARLSVGVSNTDAEISVSGSGTAYYLVSTMVDSIVTARYEGHDGPYTETRMGFDVDGVEIKCRHDFGAAAADYRGVQKELGA